MLAVWQSSPQHHQQHGEAESASNGCTGHPSILPSAAHSGCSGAFPAAPPRRPHLGSRGTWFPPGSRSAAAAPGTASGAAPRTRRWAASAAARSPRGPPGSQAGPGDSPRARPAGDVVQRLPLRSRRGEVREGHRGLRGAQERRPAAQGRQGAPGGACRAAPRAELLGGASELGPRSLGSPQASCSAARARAGHHLLLDDAQRHPLPAGGAPHVEVEVVGATATCRRATPGTPRRSRP